jgi:hypothetical protein
MAQIFMSFIHEEVKYAESVQEFIKDVLGDEIAPFLSSDSSQVYAGDRWLDRIMNELDSARVVVLMVSRLSVSRPWVNFEAGAAAIKRVPIIPVCFRGMIKAALPKPYGDYQAADLSDYSDQYYLVRSIAHHLGSLQPPLRWEPLDSMIERDSRISDPYDTLRRKLDRIHHEDVEGREPSSYESDGAPAE